jgi:hypothetical protein
MINFQLFYLTKTNGWLLYAAKQMRSHEYRCCCCFCNLLVSVEVEITSLNKPYLRQPPKTTQSSAVVPQIDKMDRVEPRTIPVR